MYLALIKLKPFRILYGYGIYFQSQKSEAVCTALVALAKGPLACDKFATKSNLAISSTKFPRNYLMKVRLRNQQNDDNTFYWKKDR